MLSRNHAHTYTQQSRIVGRWRTAQQYAMDQAVISCDRLAAIFNV